MDFDADGINIGRVLAVISDISHFILIITSGTLRVPSVILIILHRSEIYEITNGSFQRYYRVMQIILKKNNNSSAGTILMSIENEYSN